MELLADTVITRVSWRFVSTSFLIPKHICIFSAPVLHYRRYLLHFYELGRLHNYYFFILRCDMRTHRIRAGGSKGELRKGQKVRMTVGQTISWFCWSTRVDLTYHAQTYITCAASMAIVRSAVVFDFRKLQGNEPKASKRYHILTESRIPYRQRQTSHGCKPRICIPAFGFVDAAVWGCRARHHSDMRVPNYNTIIDS